MSGRKQHDKYDLNRTKINKMSYKSLQCILLPEQR